MEDERALLIAVPLRHLHAAMETGRATHRETAVIPAGGPGDLDSCAPGERVLVMPAHDADAGDDEISAATWAASFVRRVPWSPGAPWPDGLPETWTAEHPEPPPAPEAREVDEPDDEDERIGPQSFLEVADLRPLPRNEWLFANELVGKQARGGRTFQPRVPTLVFPVD